MNAALQDFDAYDPEMLRCPWAANAALRKQAPVAFDVRNAIFLVNSYDLAAQVLMDAGTYSSEYIEKLASQDSFPDEVNAIYAQGRPIVGAHLVTDGETHTRHRKIITRAFSRKRLGELAPLFDRKISTLLDHALAKGRMRFRADLADAVPLIMTQEQLRIPDEDMPHAYRWSKMVSSNHGGMERSIESLKAEARDMLAFQRYFEDKIQHEMDRLAATGAGERDDDLLTMLAAAILDPDDDMDMTTAISFVLTLFPATHDTTTAALTACMHRLTDDPESQIRAARDTAYLGNFIEEALRHETPVRSFWRRATTDTVLAGIDIPKGAWVLVRTSSANRDDAAYPDGDRFDPRRKPGKPSLIFGTGIHTCAGRMFARHIMQAVFAQLLDKAVNFRFTPGANDFEHELSLVTAAYVELDIQFDPRAASHPDQRSGA